MRKGGEEGKEEETRGKIRSFAFKTELKTWTGNFGIKCACCLETKYQAHRIIKHPRCARGEKSLDFLRHPPPPRTPSHTYLQCLSIHATRLHATQRIAHAVLRARRLSEWPGWCMVGWKRERENSGVKNKVVEMFAFVSLQT